MKTPKIVRSNSSSSTITARLVMKSDDLTPFRKYKFIAKNKVTGESFELRRSMIPALIDGENGELCWLDVPPVVSKQIVESLFTMRSNPFSLTSRKKFQITRTGQGIRTQYRVKIITVQSPVSRNKAVLNAIEQAIDAMPLPETISKSLIFVQ